MNTELLFQARSFISNKVVQVSLVFLVSISAALFYCHCIFAGFFVIFSYIIGVLISDLLWRKQSFNITPLFNIPRFKTFIASQQINTCTVCGDGSCKRQKPAKDSQPWLGLNVPKEIDQAVQDLLNKILNEFVTNWYKSFSKDEVFIIELKKNLRYASCVLLKRVLQQDIGEVISNRLIPTGFSHLHDVVRIKQHAVSSAVSIEVAAVEYLDDRLHPAVRSREAELQYLRAFCDALSPYLLQSDELHCMSFKVLMRELLAGWVLLPLSDTLCNPFCINTLLLLALSPEPLTRYPESPHGHVQFLQRFVLHPKDSNGKKSSLQSDLSTILKDQKLLYSFIQFLKKEGSVHLLQFCLDVDKFNQRMLSPDLRKEELEELHQEACTLFAVFFNPESSESIHFPKAIVQQIEQVLVGGCESITRLRTSPPLFQAYEVVYNMLEEGFCPSFYHSDEYFLLVCGPRLAADYVKPGNRKRGTGDASVVTKLSTQVQKLLQVHAVEGSAYFDTPLELSDSECTEELQVSGHMDLLYRDMSAWRVSIPSVSTGQDPNSKPYPVFTIKVVDLGARDEGEGHAVSWEVSRRYDDFYMLQSKLVEFHGEFEVGLQLPAKKGLFAPRGTEFLDTRKKLFEEYLQKLLQWPMLRGSDLLHSFLVANTEFSSALTGPTLRKIIRRSVEPIKLRKEKGQHLETFLATFQASTEGIKRYGKYEWQDVSVEPVRLRRSLTDTMFRNNFQEALDTPRGERGESCEAAPLHLSGPWDTILYVMSKLMRASTAVLQVAVTFHSLLGAHPDSLISGVINRKLREVLVPQRSSHLIRLLQGALFNSAYKPGEAQDAQHLLEQVLLEMKQGVDKKYLLRWLLPGTYQGLETVVETLQHPLLNKQLCYSLLDEIIRVVFPELVTSG